MKIIGFIAFLIGIILTAISLLGQFTDLGNYKSVAPRSWEKFDIDLIQSLDSYDSILAYANKHFSQKQFSKKEKMIFLYNTIINRFTHENAEHNIFSNWILFFLANINSTFRHIWDPELMVSKGWSLHCDQSSYLLLRLAMDHGIRGRHVGLYGHVVMEAWYNSAWHLFDPDLEVVPINKKGHILSVRSLIKNDHLLQKYYEPYHAVDLFKTIENNTYMSYPQGARFEWKSNVLVYNEKFMEILKFVIPMILLGFGLYITRKQSSNKTLFI